MVLGWTLKATAAAGDPRWLFMTQAGALTATGVIGCIPIAAGTGTRIIHGVWPSIMGAGSAIRASAGAGIRIRSGRRHGWLGGPEEIIAAGHLCRRLPFSAPVPVSFIGV